MNKVDLSNLVKEDVFKLIGSDWMLVCAGKKEGFNMMTASWGGLGWLWNKPVAFIFVRPERYTHEFIEAEERLSLSFFTEAQREALKFCGSKSGRDFDKCRETGLSAVELESGTVTFASTKLSRIGLVKESASPLPLISRSTSLSSQACLTAANFSRHRWKKRISSTGKFLPNGTTTIPAARFMMCISPRLKAFTVEYADKFDNPANSNIARMS